METIKTLICAVCGYQWLPRRLELPKVCPKCKSRKWLIKKLKGRK